MRFKSIEFKNVFGYGEEVNRIDYSGSSELILLKGKSGSGKSSILSLPTVVLYGCPSKITKSDIANRINKHGWVRGTIEKGQHTYVIEREFSPNSLKIWKDDEEVDIYGSSAGEEYIMNEIVEIPITTFSNMITISMKKFKSFLSMSPTERKQVVDEVFDVRIVNIIYDQIKKDSKELGNSINAEQSSFYTLTQTLANANNELVKIQEKNASPEDAETITKNNEEIKKLNEQLVKYNDVMSQVNQKALENNSAITEKRKQIVEVDMQMKTIQEKINLYHKEKCPTCGSPFSGEFFETVKEKLDELMNKKKELKAGYETELAELAEKSKKIQEANTKVNNGMYQIRVSINKLQADNRVIEEKLKVSSEYQAIQNIIDDTNKKIEEVKESINEKTKQLGYLQKLLTVYSIDGVTKMVINNYIPLLNQEIAENLIMLDFPYTLTFDEKFNPTIKDCGQTVRVSTLSDGEETRVNLVVLCSLYKLMRRKFTDVNLLTVDEVVSSVDPETSAYVISYLRNFADENNLNMFIVSHTELPLDMFDKIIEVEKRNGFSHFETSLMNR